MNITFITPAFAVTGGLTLEDIPSVAALGFRTLINNRPDGEEAGQIAAGSAALAAEAAGLHYLHIPSSKFELFTDPVVDAMAEALATAEGPILAHCKSGVRSAIIWAAASARTQPVAAVMRALASAGFDLAFLRDDLDSQASRTRWIGTPAVELSPALVPDAPELVAAVA